MEVLRDPRKAAVAVGAGRQWAEITVGRSALTAGQPILPRLYSRSLRLVILPQSRRPHAAQPRLFGHASITHKASRVATGLLHFTFSHLQHFLNGCADTRQNRLVPGVLRLASELSTRARGSGVQGTHHIQPGPSTRQAPCTADQAGEGWLSAAHVWTSCLSFQPSFGGHRTA